MLLCEESASIDCAREMRGIDSIANAVALAARQRARRLRARQRRKKADQDRAGPETPDLGLTRRGDLHDHIGLPHLRGIGGQLRARLGEGGVGQQRVCACAILDQDVDALGLQLATTSGTSATLCSPSAVSFGTPTRMKAGKVSDLPDATQCGPGGRVFVQDSKGRDGQPDAHLHQGRRPRRDPPRRHEPRVQVSPARGGLRHRRRAQRDTRRGAAGARAACQGFARG